LKNISTKITAFILIAILICACNAVKRVPNGKLLLTKNEISVNNKKIKDENVFNQLYQKPNGTLLGFRLRLNMYNMANLNPDSTYQAKFTNHPGKYERKAKWLSAKQVDQLGKSFWYHGIHDFLKKTGEPPVIIDSTKTEKSLLKDVNLFDVYEGQNLPEGKKSYALSFTIQDTAKTLEDAQIDKIMNKLIKNFETELGASLR